MCVHVEHRAFVASRRWVASRALFGRHAYSAQYLQISSSITLAIGMPVCTVDTSAGNITANPSQATVHTSRQLFASLRTPAPPRRVPIPVISLAECLICASLKHAFCKAEATARLPYINSTHRDITVEIVARTAATRYPNHGARGFHAAAEDRVRPLR